MIDEEFKMTCYIFVLSFMGYMVSLIVMVFVHESVTYLKLCLSWIFTLSAPSFVATLWIPRKLKKNKTLRMMERAHGFLVLKKGLFEDCRLSPDGTETISMVDEISNLFLDKQKMRALARWMIRDCTLESFLAFVELVQFKESIIAVIKEQKEHFVEGNEDRQRYKFYEHCPKSSIVFNYGLNLVEGVVVEMEEIEEEEEDEQKVPISPARKTGLALVRYRRTVDNNTCSVSGCTASEMESHGGQREN